MKLANKINQVEFFFFFNYLKKALLRKGVTQDSVVFTHLILAKTNKEQSL